MKLLVIFFVFLVSSCFAGSRFRRDVNGGDSDNGDNPPPPGSAADDKFNCENRQDGNYPNILYPCADHFFHCSDRKAYRVPCPEALRYSVKESKCVAPIYVPACPTFCAQRINGFYGDPENCRNFYFCVDRFEFMLSCRANQVYHDGVKRCVHEDEAPPPCGSAPPPKPFSCEGKSDGFYRDPTDCSMYMKCENEEMSVLACENGKAFSEPLKECLPSVSVPGCAPEQDRFLREFCVRKGADGIYPFPGNCHASVVCIQDFPFGFFCALEQRPDFDPVTLSCVKEVEGCD